MYIKEIVLDGFKSYANRTLISGFDPNFNAITGLNGSGKSNILDAICFVLGITQLQSVRVNNLQELVYKQGQSRVTKASVSIVFDNSDKAESPPGYEACSEVIVTRQIIIGGKNKYLINGHSAQNNRVQSLFQSVHLNINNPHFLIMQGKITKVLGMKPLEILGMVEEAAGTKMYEIKRNSAKKVILRKESKLAQIDSTLENEITPQLDKLKKQKVHFMTWTSNNTEIERLERFKVAFTFQMASLAASEKNKEREKMQAETRELSRKITEVKATLKNNDFDFDKLSEKRANLEENEVPRCNTLVTQLSRKCTKEKTILDNKSIAIKEESMALEEIRSLLVKLKLNLQQTEENRKEKEVEYQKLLAEMESIQNTIASLQGQQLGVDIGDKCASENKGSLTLQVIENQKKQAELESSIKTLDMKIKSLRKMAKEKEKELASKGVEESANEVDEKRLQIDALSEQIRKMEKDDKGNDVKEEIHRMNQKIQSLESQKRQFWPPVFKYRINYTGFDHSKVFGFVVNLINVKSPKFNDAIEIAAGHKLKNVVVESQRVGKELLKYGRLERRVTMIPLDAVYCKRLPPNFLENARRSTGREDIYLAVDCVSFDPKLQRAMDYIFASTVICPDIETAKQVAYGQKQRVRTVTLDGELFDVFGTLTGGFRPQKSSFLSRMESHKAISGQLKELQARMESLCAERRSFDEQREKREYLEADLNLLKHELEGMVRRSESSRLLAVQREISDCLKGEKVAEEQKQKLSSKVESVVKRLKELQKLMEKSEKSTKSVEEEISSYKVKVKLSERKLNEWKRKVEYDELEMKTLRNEISRNEEKERQGVKLLEKLKNEVVELETNILEFDKKRRDAEETLNTTKNELQALLEQIERKTLENNKLTDELESKSIELRKTQNELNRFEKLREEATQKISVLQREHAWIESEKHLFGKPSTDYDFEAVKPDFVISRLETLLEQQQDLSSRINKKVMVMFDKAEQDYNSLVKKRKIVLEDKSKIENVMRELDKKKDEVLNRTFVKVNKNFGSIFQILLPGASAKLVKVDPLSILRGIEVNVAFGSAWKDSLSELSGGQRSLLALSLILSLLLFKPAPMYILDEIDAALDLSHTQNIGRMLSSYFARSQFIVVSLKEGMFNNANVLFHVRFEHGVSAVRREVRRKGKNTASKSGGH